MGMMGWGMGSGNIHHQIGWFVGGCCGCEVGWRTNCYQIGVHIVGWTVGQRLGFGNGLDPGLILMNRGLVVVVVVAVVVDGVEMERSGRE